MQNLSIPQLLMLKSAMAQASEDGHFDETGTGQFLTQEQNRLISIINSEVDNRDLNPGPIPDPYTEKLHWINH